MRRACSAPAPRAEHPGLWHRERGAPQRPGDAPLGGMQLRARQLVGRTERQEKAAAERAPQALGRTHRRTRETVRSWGDCHPKNARTVWVSRGAERLPLSPHPAGENTPVIQGAPGGVLRAAPPSWRTMSPKPIVASGPTCQILKPRPEGIKLFPDN